MTPHETGVLYALREEMLTTDAPVPYATVKRWADIVEDLADYGSATAMHRMAAD